MSELSEAVEAYGEARKRLESLVDKLLPQGSLGMSLVNGKPYVGIIFHIADDPKCVAIKAPLDDRTLKRFAVNMVIPVDCPGDTNGDGDCMLCCESGGCPVKKK